MALVMVISMLPMTAFGQPMAYRPGTAAGSAQAIQVPVVLSAAEIVALTDVLDDDADHLRFTLAGGTAAFTNPVSVFLNGTLVQANRISTTGATVVDVDLNTLDFGTAVTTLNFEFDGIRDPSGGNITVEIWDDNAVALVPLATPIASESFTALTSVAGSVTMQRGVVQNPRQLAHNQSESFRVTVDMTQLHTVPGELSAILRMSLAENNVRFAPLGQNIDNAGTPIIRVHETSQLFLHDQPNMLIPNPQNLFTSGGPNSDTGKGALSVVPVSDPWNSLHAFLTLSNEGVALVGGQNIHRLSGVLVLEINGIIPYTAGGRITIDRVGSMGATDTVVNLLNNQLLVFGVADVGVNFNGVGPRYFTSGLWLPDITITERRALSLHHSWAPGQAQAGSLVGGGNYIGGATTHYVRLLGPRDYVWNLDNTGDVGVQPLNQLQLIDRHAAFYGSTLVDGVRIMPANSIVVLGQEIDGRTGRPALYLRLVIPNRSSVMMNQVTAELAIRNLSLFPTRDNVPSGNVVVDIEFGMPAGLTSSPVAPIWVPQPTTGQVSVLATSATMLAAWLTAGYITQAEYDAIMLPTPPTFPIQVFGDAAISNAHTTAALIQLGRGYLAPSSTVANQRANRNPHPQHSEIITAINNTPSATHLDPWQLAGLSWFPQGGGFVSENTTWTRRGDNWSGSKIVGNRTEAALELRTYGDIPELVSGQRNFPLSSVPVWTHTGDHPWSDNTNNNAFEDSRTARVQLVELAPGALDVGWSAGVVEFRLADEVREGAQLMHAAWRMQRSPLTGTTLNTEIPWEHVTIQESDILGAPTAIGVGTLDRDRFRLTIPRNAHPDRTRTLEVVFWVSTVAGYEVLFGDDLIITASGSAVNNLAAGNREAVIATVVDPIVVTLAGDPVQIDVGQVMTPTSLTPIPNIIIEETAAGRLTRGTSFTLSVEALPIPVLGNHALVDTVVIHDDSGLEVRATRVGTGQTAYMRFEVIRESVGNTPGRLVLSNNYVIGTFLPGITYGVSVNATPIAAWPTPANISRNPIAQNTSRGLTGPGNFDIIPYFIDFIEFGEFDYEGLPPGVGDDSNVGQVRGELILWANMPSRQIGSEAIDQPFMWYYNYPGLRAAMVNPRVFAAAFDLDLDWNDATRSWTITGNGVTVVGTLDSTSAVVNGESVDIATFVNFGSGPAGSVRPVVVNGRSFLPVRFFANAFGLNITLSLDGDIVTVN